MMDFMKMMKQAQELQGRLQRLQEELGSLQVEGQAGAGMVRITLSGTGEMKSVRIDPGLMKPGEAEMVEDLIVAAHEDAKAKLEVEAAQHLKQMTGGLPLPPGFQLPF